MDEPRAARLYRSAAELGFDLAVTNLGVMYAEGRGVPRDFNLAFVWYSVGAQHLGLARCDANRRTIARLMTKAEIQFSESTAENWWAKYGNAYASK